MTDLRRIAAHYGGKASSTQCNIPTPGHSKRDLGTSITLKPNAPDGLLVKCHNGTDADALAVKDMLRRDGFLPPREHRNDNNPWTPPIRPSSAAPAHAVHLKTGQRIVSTFTYEDQHGAMLYRKHRIEPGDDGRSKKFSFDRPNGRGGWQTGMGDHAVPYRLPDLIRASRDSLIYMAEGERKADKLAEWGLLATSHKDWKSFEFSGYVKGRTVIILPDNDETGAVQATKAREAVERAGGTAHLIELPGLSPGGDILDWTGTADDLAVLVERATKSTVELIELDDVADWAGLEVPPRRWLLDGWLPIGEAALLTGAGSVGKSLVSQQLAATIAAGQAFMGQAVEQATTIYITCEDGREEAQRRHKAIAETIGVPIGRGTCLVKSWKGEIDLELATFDSERRLRPTRRFKALRETALAIGARFIVLDNTSHLFGGDENVKREVAAFVNLLNGLAAEIDGVILLLGHPNKTGLNNPSAGDANQFGGSVAWENQVRSRMFMALAQGDNPDARELSNPKANYSSKGNKLHFVWYKGAFSRADDLPADWAAEMTATIRAIGETSAFLRCLAARNEQQRQVSDKPTAANYAPRVFAKMNEAKGVTKERLEAAMERLFSTGKIERGFLYRDTAEGKDIHGLREVSDQPFGNPETSPETSRKQHPEGSGNPQETTGNSVPYTTYNGAGPGGPPPLEDEDLDWGDDGREAAE